LRSARLWKSTLIVQSVYKLNLPVAWISLDKNDNYIHHFAAYFVKTVDNVLPIKNRNLVESALSGQVRDLPFMMTSYFMALSAIQS